MSLVIRLEVPIEMHYTVIPMGTSKVNSSRRLVILHLHTHRHGTKEMCVKTTINAQLK